MEISLVLAVYNQLNLTKKFYKDFRKKYSNVPLVISSASDDGTNEWLESLNDDNLIFTHQKEKLSFSENFNRAINLVKTEKLVLVHNDMIIGDYFVENIDKLLTENIFLSYTTIEPPIFCEHKRPGKVIMDLGLDYSFFNYELFDFIVNQNKNKTLFYPGASFFMSGYKKSFMDVGLFDGITFTPSFCEDDDFLLRAKLKGYNLVTTECAMVYHFVSKTSRYSDEYQKTYKEIERNSNRNFIRKWGMTTGTFHQIGFSKMDNFSYKKITIGLNIAGINNNILEVIEPLFDKINCNDLMLQSLYIQNEQSKTRFNLNEKFQKIDECDVIVNVNNKFTNQDLDILSGIRFTLQDFKKGEYQINNLKLIVNKDI